MRVTYCAVSDVDSRATDESQTAWSGLTASVKTRLVFDATDDIKAAHQKPDQGGIPWGYAYLREAAETRCMFLARVYSLKSVKERTEYLGADSINDGILSMSGMKPAGLDPATAAQVKSVLKSLNTEEFCRG